MPRSLFVLPLAVLFSASCAGVKQNSTSGNGGTGGTGTMMIPGLSMLVVNPPSSTVPLGQAASGGPAPTMVTLTATGTVMGAMQDVTSQVGWTVSPTGATVSGGVVTVSAPGTFTVTAQSGTITAQATIMATFMGDVFGTGFNTTNNNKGALDGSPSGGSASIAYPLDHAVFPSNLTPIYAQISGTGSIARINFQATGLSINYYANCLTADADSNDPFPNTAGNCYVDMPLSLTQLLIAASANEDIMMKARLFGTALSESQTVSVAWSNVKLSGGLYYWSTIPSPTRCPNATDQNPVPNPPSYCLLDNPANSPSGTAIYRYAFDLNNGGSPTPTTVWTDDGGPSSNPKYDGAPQAFDSGTAGGHCIGCHSISNKGNFMALTLGGSSNTNGANFSLLDIASQTLININPSASTDPSSTPSQNPTDYWKKFRMESLATENAWGPNEDRVVSMYLSKLYLTLITATPGMLTGSAMRMAPVVPTWQAQEPYATDPFWSQDGTLFAFTSFAQPSVGMYNTTGLNGDMKQGGQIVIATADANGINDDAHVLVSRGNNVTSYYPSISNDSKLVVFNTSNCGSGTDINKSSSDYGNGTCDGYDDSSATLWIVSPGGGASTNLMRANGNGAYDNSWPRFAPDKGTFRGNDLYWVAFSSRRPYGTQLNTGGGATTKPQLWLAGVQRGEIIVGDPSYSPVWLPAQNPRQVAPNGNHVPQWVKVAVVIN
jgi:hypothetical protein